MNVLKLISSSVISILLLRKWRRVVSVIVAAVTRKRVKKKWGETIAAVVSASVALFVAWISTISAEVALFMLVISVYDLINEIIHRYTIYKATGNFNESIGTADCACHATIT